MPGLSIVVDEGGVDRAAADAALERCEFLPRYDHDHHVVDETVYVADTGYETYPVRRFDFDGTTVVVEGYLYDVEDLEGELRQVASWLEDSRTMQLRDWLASRDGEFVIAVQPPDGDLRVLNDPLCRLPLYRATVGERTVVSRELTFVREWLSNVGEPVELDRLGVAQTLLFGYTLGTRTVFEGVSELDPATCLTFDGDVRTDSLYEHAFEQSTEPASVDAAGRRLARKFAEACRNRADIPGRAVLSLSGGLDSRAVAAGYDAAGVPFSAATFVDEDADELPTEATVARSVAETLDVEWTSVATPRDDLEDVEATLLEMKQGMNYLRMGFIVEFFEELYERYGEVNYVTGDGGDKVFHDLRPPRRYDSLSDLVEYAVEANSVFSPERAAAIAGISEEHLLESVRRRFRSYPESSLENRYTHFMLRERGMKLIKHGEDRNRYFFWSVTPFYSFPFFQAAMEYTPDCKQYMRLYRSFVGALAPDLLAVDYADYGVPITSLEYRAKHVLYLTLSRWPRVKSAVVDRVLGTPKARDTDLPDRVRALLGETGDSLSEREVATVLDDERYSEATLYHLYTMCALAASLDGSGAGAADTGASHGTGESSTDTESSATDGADSTVSR
ncbi:asparagine synthase-related protein [Halomarina litorea]|uniref:asparagine synthase-related protein n=1 Tax=Halomarina litorea TaxID=2961595 RepID=UPI0020C279C0|nr:asparagine synthase-related protein [Halomarina sp. BCD28]